MKLFSRSVLLASCVLTLCFSSLAATEYVIANHDSHFENFISVYTLDTSSGALKQVGDFDTNGTGLGGLSGVHVNFANIEQAITAKGACIFALNAYSSDIAAFSAATKYSLVGNYSNSALNASYNGGSLALTPNGKFLYASYSYTGNIGAWQVNPDCSLTFISSYIPLGGNALGAIKVSPNGQALIVPFDTTVETPGMTEMFRIDGTSGSLTDLGYLANPCNLTVTCNFYGLDFTRDNKFVVLSALVHGNVGENAYALTAQITSNGLVKPRNWPLPNSLQIDVPISPFFSAAGYSGAGNLYFGSTNGVITVDFTENPLKLAVTNAQIVGSSEDNGNIAVTGNTMVMGAPADEIDVFSINSDGALTTLNTTTVTGQDLDVFSLTLFPSTR
jgi:6-phosphogluconolactonase (cycloisomerase 2 family)